MTRLLHLGAAYSLALWLTGNELDAEDVVQEAYLGHLVTSRVFRAATGKVSSSLLSITLITAG
jgi:DNA-directed RNA polymerase specialized sigma24 family protein